jgi:hypothetical protein
MGFMPAAFGSVAGIQGGYTTTSPAFTFGPPVITTLPATPVNGAPAGNLPASVVPRYVDTPYVQSFNAQAQQEFYWGTVLSLGYVGALDRHLPFVEQLNAGLPGSTPADLPFAPLGRTASTLLFANGLTSNYNALQVNLSKRFARGLSFVASYTWSHSLGYTTNNNLLLNPFNFQANYGPLDTDRRSVLTISHLWELPFGHHGSSMKQTLIGGWQVNGVFTWSSGVPFTVTSDPLLCNCLNGTAFANVSGPPYLSSGTAVVLDPASFSAPVNSLGSTGRNSFLAPGFRNYDMSLFKNFHVHDRYNVQIRAEAYNISNSPHFALPVANVNSPVFGQQVSTLYGSFGRQINLALRLGF